MAAKKGGAVALQQDVANDEEWDALLRRPGLLLIDVYSEWCGPCVGMLANLKKIKRALFARLLSTRERDLLNPSELMQRMLAAAAPKVELGGDLLILATAKSDSIEALRRHRNHSEPVWMLVSGGKLINLIFGADAPRIARLIASELDNEAKLQRGGAGGESCSRTYMTWDELTPEEQARMQRAEEKRLHALKEEEERRARALHQQRVDGFTKLAAKVNRYTVVLVLPHAVPEGDADAEGGALGALRDAWAVLGLEERRRLALAVTADMANDVFFEARLPQHEELIKAMATGPCLAIMLYKPPTEVEVFPEPEAGAEAEAANGDASVAPEGAEQDAAPAAEAPDDAPPPEEAAPATPPQPQRVLVEPEMGEVEALAAQSLYGFYPGQEAAPPPPAAQQQQQPEPQPDAVDTDQWSRIQPAADSPAAACVLSGSGPDGSGPALPGLWTPLTPLTKAAALQTLFPEDTDALTRPPPPPSLLPPSLVHVFGAVRCKDVLAATTQFDGAVTGSGFFGEQRELLAADEAEFEALKRERQDGDVFVVAVSVEAAGALEALAALQPSAVSGSAEEGAADCDAFFPGPPPEVEADGDDHSLSGFP